MVGYTRKKSFMGKILFIYLGRFLLQMNQNQAVKAYLIKYKIQFIINLLSNSEDGSDLDLIKHVYEKSTGNTCLMVSV